MNTTGEATTPRMSEVASAIGEAATQLESFVSTVIEEQPGVALAAAAAAGFLAGGGLNSRIGTRLTTGTLKATLGNLTTLMALDMLRRALENGGESASTTAAGAE
jgi:uncharacterized membrane protein YfcA